MTQAATRNLRKHYRDWRVFRRALIVAMIVGPILALINHGDAIMAGMLTEAAILKILITFAVPFCVSLISSLLTIREAVKQGAEPTIPS